MAKQNQYVYQRGEIKDNALKALVTDKLFSTRVVKAKKGKGSYRRKERFGNDYKKSPVISVLRSIDYWAFSWRFNLISL